MPPEGLRLRQLHVPRGQGAERRLIAGRRGAATGPCPGVRAHERAYDASNTLY
jgi:hypothetical protein